MGHKRQLLSHIKELLEVVFYTQGAWYSKSMHSFISVLRASFEFDSVNTNIGHTFLKGVIPHLSNSIVFALTARFPYMGKK